MRILRVAMLLISGIAIACSFSCGVITESWTTYTNEKDGLVDNSVRAIAIDEEGNKWFGTLGGVSKFDGESWTTYSREDGLAGNVAYCIAIDDMGNKWFGTMLSKDDFVGSGVSKFDGTSWTTYTTEDGLADNRVLAIAADDKGNVWFGTDNGVSKFNGMSWNSFNVVDGLISNEVWSVAIDKKGNKWFGTDMGISVFDDSNWINYRMPCVYCIAIDAEDNMWFGTREGGIYKYDGTDWITYSVDEITYPIDTPEGRAYVDVFSIDSDEAGDMWFAIASSMYGIWGGISSFDGEYWNIYTAAEGWAWLNCTYVTSLGIDDEGNKWLGTDNGVIRLGRGTPIELSHERIFVDANLEAAVRQELAQSTGQFEGVMNQSDLVKLTGLFIRNRNISDLTGLEYCSNLLECDLSRNNISDISQLSDLIYIYNLHLENNNISDISPLSNLTNLVYLHIANNDISDISPLLECRWLDKGGEVYLYGNPLDNTSINVYIPELIDRGVQVFFDK